MSEWFSIWAVYLYCIHFLSKERFSYFRQIISLAVKTPNKNQSHLVAWRYIKGKSFHFRLSYPGGGVLGISSDGDDGRIFLGLKFSIPGFFWVRKFGLGSLIWVGIFWGYKKNQMRERIYSDGMMNKQTRVFNFQCFSLCYSTTPFLELLRATKSAWDFLGVNFWSRDFFGFCWKS